MTLDEYSTVSDYAVASATIVLALAALAYLAQWGFAGKTAAASSLVAAGDNGARPVASPPPPPERSQIAGGIGTSLTTLSWAILLVGVVARGLAAQRVPWGNMYEFACVAILFSLTLYLVLVKVTDASWLGPIVTGVGVIVLGASKLVYVPVGPLVPALDSYWLVIHVAAAMVAGAGFLVGAALSLLYLIKSRAEANTPAEDRTSYLWRLPSSAAMDQLAFRVHAFSFPVWTFAALIAGPIWAQQAWGRYWGWDPKEVWAFITWVIYAGYLHARVTAGWKGRAAATIAIVGFVAFMFSFWGVNLVFPGLHSYAK